MLFPLLSSIALVIVTISFAVPMLSVAVLLIRENPNFDIEISGFLNMMVSGLLQGVWSVVVFFAIPVYVVENLGLIAATWRSWDIFKQTWGESFTGKAAIGGVGCLVKLMILAIIVALIAVTAATKYLPLLGLTILFGIVSFTVLALIDGAINGVFQASLYHYATTGVRVDLSKMIWLVTPFLSKDRVFCIVLIRIFSRRPNNLTASLRHTNPIYHFII